MEIDWGSSSCHTLGEDRTAKKQSVKPGGGSARARIGGGATATGLLLPHRRCWITARRPLLHQSLGHAPYPSETKPLFCYTELQMVAPDSGIIGLHAENLEIVRVAVNGEPAEFDVFPHYQPVKTENRWCSVSSVSSAADAAGLTYISALERELVPNLLILCQKPIDTGQ